MHVQFPKLTTRVIELTAVAAAAVTIAGLSIAPAQAAPDLTIPVPCSTEALFAAVSSAPSGSTPSGWTLLLAPGCTYVLDQGLPMINRALTFIGGPSTLARSDAEETSKFSIMSICNGGYVVLHDVSFVNGDSSDDRINR